MKTPQAPQTRAPKYQQPASKTAKSPTDNRSPEPTQSDGSANTALKPSAKRGKKEEYSAPIPRVRQVFALMLQNQREDKQRFPTNADIGRALQPVEQMVGSWRNMVSARGAFGRVRELLSARDDQIVLILEIEIQRPHRQARIAGDGDKHGHEYLAFSWPKRGHHSS